MNKITKIRKWLVDHKILGTIIILLTLLVIYWGYGKIFGGGNSQTTYVIAAVQKGTIISSVSGSGQVSASNQVDLQSKVAGNVVYIGAKVGDRVGTGALIAQIDSQDAAIALENAQIALKKLTQVDQLSLTQAENALTDAQAANQKAYDDGFSNVTTAFVDLPTVMSGLYDLVAGAGGNGYLNEQRYISDDTERGYATKVASSYYIAKNSYDKSFALYKTITRTSSPESIRSLVDNVYQTTKEITQAVKDAQNAAEYIRNQSDKITTEATTAQNNLSTWLSLANGNLQSLNSSANTISSSARSLTEKTVSLAEIKSGADPLDVRSQELNIQQKQSAYADSFIRAPFSGMLASLSISRGDSLNSGASIGTFITENKVADISLNEVDVARVKVGQKATITFDAIDSLSITGQVLQVDLVGTVSQGVVSYNVKIGFDTQDERIKSGMSTSVSIITDVKQDILVVPNSALKNQSGISYVGVVDKNTSVSTNNLGLVLTVLPTEQAVQTGATDDTSTEIVSGLNEGDKIVVKTVAPTTANTTASAPSILNAAGTGSRTGATGGATRALGR